MADTRCVGSVPVNPVYSVEKWCEQQAPDKASQVNVNPIFLAWLAEQKKGAHARPWKQGGMVNHIKFLCAPLCLKWKLVCQNG